jgi:prepilin-type N-terminal cleavage/methylation domain-containing protein
MELRERVMANPLRQARRRQNQSGYSLIEVLIAVAILGVVLLSIVTLFFMGRSNVYSGKQMTEGVAVGTHVMEDISQMTMSDMYTAFNITGTTVLGNVDVDTTRALPNDLYTGSIIRQTSSISSGTDPGGYLTRWRNEIVNNNKFTNGVISLVLTPTNPNPVGAAITPANNTMMRVRVLVRWQESQRPRQVIFDTVKTQRP